MRWEGDVRMVVKSDRSSVIPVPSMTLFVCVILFYFVASCVCVCGMCVCVVCVSVTNSGIKTNNHNE